MGARGENCPGLLFTTSVLSQVPEAEEQSRVCTRGAQCLAGASRNPPPAPAGTGGDAGLGTVLARGKPRCVFTCAHLPAPPAPCRHPRPSLGGDALRDRPGTAGAGAHLAPSPGQGGPGPRVAFILLLLFVGGKKREKTPRLAGDPSRSLLSSRFIPPSSPSPSPFASFHPGFGEGAVGCLCISLPCFCKQPHK